MKNSSSTANITGKKLTFWEGTYLTCGCVQLDGILCERVLNFLRAL